MFFKKLKSQKGQLLIEMLVSLTIGGIFIAGAAIAILGAVRQNYENKSNQLASLLSLDLVNKVQSFANYSWSNILNLSKGSSSKYFFIPGATSSILATGTESVFYNDINAGLVGYWKMDEATGTAVYDYSGNNISGSFTSGATRSSSCMFGSCFSLDGLTGRINLSNFSTGGESGYTVSGWFYRTGDATSNYAGIRVGRVELRIRGSAATYTNCPQLIVYTSYPNYFGTSDTVNAIPLNTWTHIAGVYDYNASAATATVKIYNNGVLTKTGTTGTVGTIASYTGGYIGYISGYFPGYIDDVRAYNRALSANELKALYDNFSFTRYFYVDNINRDSCGVGDITTSTITACTQPGGSGVANSSSTQKITSVVEWGDSRSSKLSTYLTRNRAGVFTQNNWSGSSGYNGPITSPDENFSSSTAGIIASKNLKATTGASASHYLYSSIFDTGISSGVSVNNILYQGTKPSGTNVTFQLAFSNSSSGPWNYVGYDSSSTTEYSPSDPDISYKINNIHDYRYLRYKAILLSATSTPTVSSISIGFGQ